jgi:hypothetical protein
MVAGTSIKAGTRIEEGTRMDAGTRDAGIGIEKQEQQWSQENG